MRRCLIVEDQALIGMAIESALEETDSWTCDLVHSAADALAYLNRMKPDAAILDYVLRDGVCTELARTLHGSEIPFLIYSGHHRSANLPSELAQVTWIEKPTDHTRLVRTLGGLAQARSEAQLATSA